MSAAYDYAREIDDAREHTTYEPERPGRDDCDTPAPARALVEPRCTCTPAHLEAGGFDWWCAVDHTKSEGRHG